MKKEFVDWGNNFQTPAHICDYMASFVPIGTNRILVVNCYRINRNKNRQ